MYDLIHTVNQVVLTHVLQSTVLYHTHACSGMNIPLQILHQIAAS